MLDEKYGKGRNYRTWSKDKSISFKIRSKWNSLIGIFLRNIGQALKQGNSILQKSTLLRWMSSGATELRNQTLVRPYPQFQSRKLSQLWLVPHIVPPLHREPIIFEKIYKCLIFAQSERHSTLMKGTPMNCSSFWHSSLCSGVTFTNRFENFSTFSWSSAFSASCSCFSASSRRSLRFASWKKKINPLKFYSHKIKRMGVYILTSPDFISGGFPSNT